MDKDYKVVLVNTKDPDGEKILNESKHVVRQVPDDYFKFQSVGQHDFCHISLSGQLADDPAFYFRKEIVILNGKVTILLIRQFLLT